MAWWTEDTSDGPWSSIDHGRTECFYYIIILSTGGGGEGQLSRDDLSIGVIYDRGGDVSLGILFFFS